LWTGSAAAACPVESTAQLREAVTLEGIRTHQEAFQGIADLYGGTRAAGTSGHDASAEYVLGVLTDAGYAVTYQNFDFPYFEEQSPPVLQQISPTPTNYPPNNVNGFFTMLYSTSGDVTAPIAVAENFGCQPVDFLATDFTGKIAVIERGVCYFYEKANNAVNAGAIGVMVYNDAARVEAFQGSLGGPGIPVPVVGVHRNVGLDVIASEATVRIAVNTISEYRETFNVLAERPVGRADRVVVAGGHLDSVLAGPGINDNGSGTGTLLEIAVQMAQLDLVTENRVRFAFWGAEELGLIGSYAYVGSLAPDELQNIIAYLNFDMIGSPNFVRFVYDGDGSDTALPGPYGSRVIEDALASYFHSRSLATEPTVLGSRSDHAAFADAGIPVGGLFTGAEGIKTPEQAAVFGGNAGQAYDPCYHQACDTFDNVLPGALTAIDQMSDAAAHAILCMAQTPVRLDAGDCNHDGLLDLLDYQGLTDCLDGPDFSTAPGCECFDVDESGSVDVADFAIMQRGY